MEKRKEKKPKEEDKGEPISKTRPSKKRKQQKTASFEVQELKLLLGCYDGTVIIIENTKDNEWNTYNAKIADHSIKAIAASTSHFAAGGYEEKIHFLKLNSKDGMLLENHTGTIINLLLHKNKYLFSAGEDQQISIWKLQPSPFLLHTLNHKKSKNLLDMAIHENGRVLLTLHSGAILNLWNLMTGHRVFEKTLKTPTPGFRVGFIGKENKKFFVAHSKGVCIYSTEEEEKVEEIEADDKVLSVAYTNSCIFLGLEKLHGVGVISLEEKPELHIEKHENLWKGQIKLMSGIEIVGGTEISQCVCCATKEGEVTLYAFPGMTLLHSASTRDSKLTCLCGVHVKAAPEKEKEKVKKAKIEVSDKEKLVRAKQLISGMA